METSLAAVSATFAEHLQMVLSGLLLAVLGGIQAVLVRWRRSGQEARDVSVSAHNAMLSMVEGWEKEQTQVEFLTVSIHTVLKDQQALQAQMQTLIERGPIAIGTELQEVRRTMVGLDQKLDTLIRKG